LLSCNFLTLSILSIWYISCRQKWKTILLIPVFAEIIKISLNIDYSKYNYVNNGFYYSILIFIIYAYVLNYFSKKLKYKRIKKSVSELLNNEINNQIILLNKIEIKNYKSLKIKLKKLKKNKEKIEKKVYLKQLISLRDRLTI
jgi:K+ transporter